MLYERRHEREGEKNSKSTLGGMYHSDMIQMSPKEERPKNLIPCPKFNFRSLLTVPQTSPAIQAKTEESLATESVKEEVTVNEPIIQEKSEEKPNLTGLPDNLKAGVENLSGYSLDDVRVHYNSPKPAQLQALAYTQGTDIHVAPGQEEHLPHEAWHVVQQMQGRVKPTMQMKGVQINDDEGLEREADVMGEKLTSCQNFKNSEKYLLSKAPIKGDSILQGLFLPQAQKNIAEDRKTLIQQYYKASKDNRQEDMKVIIAKQREITIKVPSLIPLNWSPDVEFEMDASLYGIAKEELQKSIKGKPGWRLGMKLFEHSDLYFAEEFVSLLNFSLNPSVPLVFLLKIKEKGALAIKGTVYRNSSYGPNGMTYEFAVSGTQKSIAEWHVHWGAKGSAGNPGWKKGESGPKTGNEREMDEMKKLLGRYWGKVKNTGGFTTI